MTVTHLNPDQNKTPEELMAKAEKVKYDRYLPNYELNPDQLIPLVFGSNGGWSGISYIP